MSTSGWLLWSHRIISTEKCPLVTFKGIGFFSRDFQLFHRLTWLGPSSPSCKGTAFNLLSNWSFPNTPYSFPLSVSCRLLSRHSVRTSWEFSLEQVGISPTYQVTYLLRGRMKVPPLMSIRAMECWLATLDASSVIMSHASEQMNAAGIGVICKGAWIALHFLLARLQGYSFQLVVQLVFPTYILQLPSVCVLLAAFKKLSWNKLGILTGTSWHFSDISRHICSVGAWKFFTWCQ